jgi:hypothetical protein
VSRGLRGRELPGWALGAEGCGAGAVRGPCGGRGSGGSPAECCGDIGGAMAIPFPCSAAAPLFERPCRKVSTEHHHSRSPYPVCASPVHAHESFAGSVRRRGAPPAVQ